MADNTALVAILGASPNPERYAWLAQQALDDHCYRVIPVSAKYAEVGGIPAVKSLEEIDEKIHTVTVYLNPSHLTEYVDQLMAVKPGRVIFNPGSESPEVMEKLKKAGIQVEPACTLVLLRTDRF